MDGAAIFETVLPYVFGGSGWVAVIKLWADVRKASQRREATASRERTDLVAIAQEAAAGVIEALREDIDRERDQHKLTRARVASLEEELRQLRREHAAVIADKDAKIALLEGTLRMREAEIHGLEDIIRRAGITLPVRSQPYWETRDGVLHPVIQELPE